MNYVVLAGRLTKDVDLRNTSNNKIVGSFTLAVQRYFKNADGVYEADFINCVVFGKSAETLSEYTEKGDLIGVNGRIQTRNYEDDKGKKHYITEVVVEKISFLQQKKKDEFKDLHTTTKSDTNIEITEDDLPF